jgi:DNA-binding NtrC family response regulator
MQPRPADTNTRATILVVDDDECIVRLVREMLAIEGYAVVEARSAEAAIEAFEEEPERIDLLLSDVIMPVMAGPVLAERLRARSPDLPVVFMSGYADCVGDDYDIVAKPFSVSDLLHHISRALSESRPCVAGRRR